MTRITVPRFLIVLFAVIGGVWLLEQLFGLLYRIADILLLFGLAWLLKLLLDPPIRRLEQWKVPRAIAIAIAYLLTLGGMIGGLVALTPQIAAITLGIPDFIDDLVVRAARWAVWLRQQGIEVDARALTSQVASLGTELGRTVAGRAVAVAQSVVSVLGQVALVIFVSIYMSLTRGRMKGFVRPVVPPRWREEYDAFINDVNNAYSSYIRGFFYIVALGTLMSATLLFGFRIPNPVPWVLAVLVLRLVPFIGGALANALLVTVLLVELALPTAIVAMVVLAVAQTILTGMVLPRVMGRELGINPLLVLFAVLLGARIYGLAGVLFAIPAAAVIVTVLGKAVNRYLLPAYERPGWWRERITIAEESLEEEAAIASERTVTPVGRATRPPVEVPSRVKEPS